MKISNRNLFAILAVALTTSIPASAATTFTNADPLNSLVSNAGNWDNGLPTGGNAGTININASATSDAAAALSGYGVTQTGGIFSQGGVAAVFLTNNTTWTINGGSTSVGFRGFSVRTGSDFILTTGTVNTASGRDWALGDAGSTMTIDGGSIDFGRSLVMQGTSGGIFTINAGTATGTGSIGGNSIQDNTHTLNFNSGTTTFGNLDLRGDNTFFNFGGSTVGSLAATTLNSNLAFGSNSRFDWTAGSLMTLDITGQTLATYQDLYTAGDLLFGGLNSAPFATNFQVSGSTLSLVVIPEPHAALLGGLGLLALLRRRRC